MLNDVEKFESEILELIHNKVIHPGLTIDEVLEIIKEVLNEDVL